ncbi:hypothetical protein O6H91_16G070400 [Diphasiastrum complanatum]|uniref:Uncharacterized protein n=2 Tax=Diphasiastrum complanatum TaxID=34168 RepID=A0ACC2BEA8_DIPCM|nr:hypothetical protein O6H91_16G070400 [Diphasiastrum complanatum]KAJ7527778.1 hypothetical protein O6H91_16G070400 [Diphasiastrum complanatum]
MEMESGLPYADQNGYTVTLPEKLHTGKWNVHRSKQSPYRLVDSFLGHPEIQTLHDNFVYAAQRYSASNFLGSRIDDNGAVADSYKWMTYEEAASARFSVGSALLAHGIQKGACIGLYLINCPEWLITEHACSSYSYVSVPLYDTLGADAVKYIINHAGIEAVFCASDKLQTLLDCLPEIQTVRLIVVIGKSKDLTSLQSKPGVEIIPFSRLESQGRSDLRPFCPPSPEDVATICYTSGTTGTPKGAILSHANLIASSAGLQMVVQFQNTDVHISYLPLAHIYERANVVAMAHAGVAIGFYQGNVLKLLDDMEVLQPTIFMSVPRLFNKIYDSILTSVRNSGAIRERIFNVAFKAKKQAIERGQVPSPIWDRLVFNKIKAKLGGRIRFIVSGASPISPEVLEFLRICFGGRVCEGYGMTESSCLISIGREGDNTSGHVGPPSPSCEIKLADVPEMDYTNEDKPYPRGEICVRGPIVFQGYYKDEKQTKEIMDEDDWLHTGDIGLWLPGGKLKIIDRKKNIFKLAQGEYIAPEKIENVYQKSKFISQCFIYGDSFNSNLVAVVVVDPDILPSWAKLRGLKHADDIGKLCQDPAVKAAVFADMNTVARDAQLRGFEFAKAITLVSEPFTLENGLLTPTFKVKRPQAKAYFAKAIEDMYAELERRTKASQPRASL